MAEGHKPIPSSSSNGRISCSGSRHYHGIFTLQRGDRLYGMRTTNGLRTRFGQTEMLNFAFSDQIFYGARNIFDGQSDRHGVDIAGQ